MSDVHFTRTEREIIGSLAEGMTQPEISKARFRSADTIKKHVANALHKCGAKNTAHLVMIACRLGIVRSIFYVLIGSNVLPAVKYDVPVDDKRKPKMVRVLRVRSGREWVA